MVDLLALDDFGAQSDMAWAREKLYQLVNYRVHPDAQQPAHGGHVQGMKREVSLYHSRVASRLKAAVHVRTSAPGGAA